jgi:glycosyltransferase involved in cell wall biosynthesis
MIGNHMNADVHSTDRADLPVVSVIVPIRNEADFIRRCLESILANDYPADKLEIIVVDGMSTDGTCEILAEMAGRDSRLRVLNNPSRIVPHAMNAGIRAASGAVIVRVDGHAEVDKDFLLQSVLALKGTPEAWCAGGPVETISRGWVGNSIAESMKSPMGVGDAHFRLGDRDGYVDTLAFGAYWRWVFDRIGMFDEELVRNQDDELNFRIIDAGGKIFLSRKIHSVYYSRSSLSRLARQYYQYGFWRIRTIQKHGKPATLRQVIPLGFVLFWLGMVAASLIWKPLVWVLSGFALLYLAWLIAGMVEVWRRSGFKNATLSPIVFAILQFGYGLGSLHGVIWWILLRRGTTGAPCRMSR